MSQTLSHLRVHRDLECPYRVRLPDGRIQCNNPRAVEDLKRPSRRIQINDGKFTIGHYASNIEVTCTLCAYNPNRENKSH